MSDIGVTQGLAVLFQDISTRVGVHRDGAGELVGSLQKLSELHRIRQHFRLVAREGLVEEAIELLYQLAIWPNDDYVRDIAGANTQPLGLHVDDMLDLVMLLYCLPAHLTVLTFDVVRVSGQWWPLQTWRFRSSGGT